MTKLDDFLNSIRDGTWHNFPKLSKKLNIPLNQLITISKSLSEQDILQYEEKLKWVKLNPEWKPLLVQEEQEEEKMEHKPSVATIIIPAQGSISIQNIHITNATDKDIELWIRACKKRVELAISKIE